MSFAEELERTLDVLTDRLRDDVARQVRSVAGELAAAAQAERDSLVPPSPEPQAIVPTETNPPAERLAASIRALTAARSLSETLDILVRESAHAASRVAVVLVRGARFQGWRLHGFDAAADNPPFDLSDDEAGVIREAVETAASASSAGAPAFANLAAGEPCLALPIAIGGQTVAVLYADTVQGPASADQLEILALHAARCLEALTAIKAARQLMAPAERDETFEAKAHA
jgi:hypothetical protein